MTVSLDETAARAALLVFIAVVAVISSVMLSRWARWAPAGPLMVMAAAPLVPALPVAFGISTDDILPAVGALLCLASVDWRHPTRAGWPAWLAAGAVLMAVAGVLSGVVNADSASSALTMILKGAGHVVFLVVIATAVALTMPIDRRRVYVATAVAAVATFEAVFGLVAWLVPLPSSAGLEPARQMTSLLGHVPGRVAGTTGLSPNFLGALFVLSLPLTVALALRAGTIRGRVAWWVASALQLVVLALTFTRTSLAIAIIVIAVILLARGHLRLMAVMGALVLVVALATPLGVRLIGDANDRAALWTSAVRMMVDHPAFGVGPGRMLDVAALDPERYQITQFGVAVNNAHNTILLAGAETGVPGALGSLIVNLSLAATALAAVLRGLLGPGDRRTATYDLEWAAALGVLGFLVQGMTNNLFAVQVTSVGLALVFGAFLMPHGPGLWASLRATVDRLRRGPEPIVPSPSEP